MKEKRRARSCQSYSDSHVPVFREGPLQRGAHVAKMLCEEIDGLGAGGQRRTHLEPLKTVGEVFGMASCDCRAFATFCKLLPRIRSCGVEESIAHRSSRIQSHERFIDERAQCFCYLGQSEVFPGNGQRRFQRESTDQDGKTP